MSTEVDKSIKLVFNEFQKSISEVPLEVYYQTIVSDMFNSNGYQFNIKQPGNRALLDSDIWIEYSFQIQDSADDEINNMYSNNQAGGNADNYPANDNRFAMRSGNIFARATQNLNVQINNQTLNVRPIQWIDALNRIYVSNDQAEHEFSASGGRFDEGNHSERICPYLSNGWTEGNNQTFAVFGNMVPNAFAIANAAAAANQNTHVTAFVFPSWSEPIPPTTGARDIMLNLYPNFPHEYEFYNPGFESRYFKTSRILRENLINDTISGAIYDRNSDTQFNGTPAVLANRFIYNFRVLERLPMPLFKMYSNDECFGVIPNIVQMQITGIFISKLEEMLFRSNVHDLDIEMLWTNVTNADCKLYLRWYTPPMQMAIPKEIHVPYKKIVNWSKNVTLNDLPVDGSTLYRDTDIQEYNVTLEAIPDLLLIYIKYRATEYNFITPDDYNLEIRDFSINIDNASGKLNQVQSIDLYNKWKKLLKHSDNKIINYEEWRRYCCVACLQPEDYGCRYGPGYSNQTVLGVKFNARNWHVAPSIMFQDISITGGYDEVNDAVETSHGELCITSIYYKNKLVIRADGSASQELTKIAADFDMTRPADNMNLGQGGMGALNA